MYWLAPRWQRASRSPDPAWHPRGTVAAFMVAAGTVAAGAADGVAGTVDGAAGVVAGGGGVVPASTDTDTIRLITEPIMAAGDGSAGTASTPAIDCKGLPTCLMIKTRGTGVSTRSDASSFERAHFHSRTSTK